MFGHGYGKFWYGYWYGYGLNLWTNYPWLYLPGYYVYSWETAGALAYQNTRTMLNGDFLEHASGLSWEFLFTWGNYSWIVAQYPSLFTSKVNNRDVNIVIPYGSIISSVGSSGFNISDFFVSPRTEQFTWTELIAGFDFLPPYVTFSKPIQIQLSGENIQGDYFIFRGDGGPLTWSSFLGDFSNCPLTQSWDNKMAKQWNMLISYSCLGWRFFILKYIPQIWAPWNVSAITESSAIISWFTFNQWGLAELSLLSGNTTISVKTWNVASSLSWSFPFTFWSEFSGLQSSTIYQWQLKKYWNLGNINILTWSFTTSAVQRLSLYGPSVVSSIPENNSISNDPLNLSIRIVFDKHLNQSSLSWSIQVMSQTGSVIPVQYLYTWDNSRALTISPLSSLSYDTEYNILLSGAIFDVNGDHLMWNIPATEWGGHKITFRTFKNPANISSLASGVSNAFVIQNSIPSSASNYPQNAPLFIQFSQKLNINSVNASTISLHKMQSSGVLSANLLTWGNLTVVGNWKLLKINKSLDIGNYKLIVKNSVKNDQWIQLDGKTSSTVGDFYIIDFVVVNRSLTSATQSIVSSYIKPDFSRFEIWLSTLADESTISKDTVQLQNYSGNLQNYELVYDPGRRTIVLNLNNPLIDSAWYYLTLKYSLKDVYWNPISSSLVTGFTQNSSDFRYDFTTPSVISAIDLFVQSFSANLNQIELKYSKPIKNPLNSTNYRLYASGWYTVSTILSPLSFLSWAANVGFSGSAFMYDQASNILKIQGLGLPPSSSNKKTVVALKLQNENIQDQMWSWFSAVCNNTVASYNSYFDACVWINLFVMLIDSPEQEEQSSSGTTLSVPANIVPLNNIASKETNYKIAIPLGESAPNISDIELVFPQQFNVASIGLDNNSPLNKSTNWSIKYSLSLNNQNPLLHLWFTPAANSVVEFELSGIINPSIANDISKGWYKVDVLLKSDRIVLKKMVSSDIYIKPMIASDQWAVLTLQIQNNGSNLNQSWLIVYLQSNWTVSRYISDNNGRIIVPGLLKNQQYSVFLDPIVRNSVWNTNYIFDWKTRTIVLSTDVTLNLPVLNKMSDSSSLVTVSWTIQNVSWKNVVVYISSSTQYFEKILWTSTGSTISYDIQVPLHLGKVKLWLKPYIPKDFELWKYEGLNGFQVPSAVDLSLSNQNIWSQNFSLPSSVYNIPVQVLDQSGSAIPFVDLTLYSPSWLYPSLNVRTWTSWSINIPSSPWVYKLIANKSWLAPIPLTTIEVLSNWNIRLWNDIVSTVTLKGSLSSYSISWKVVDEDWNPLAGVSMYAFNPSLWKNSTIKTDSSWLYTFYVENNSIRKIWGRYDSLNTVLTEQTVTVNNSTIFSGNTVTVNFILDTNQQLSYSWAILMDNSPLQWANISLTNTITNSVSQWFSDSQWKYSLFVPSWTYIFKVYHPQYWQIRNQQITINSSSLQNLSLISYPVTVQLKNSNNSAITDTGSLSWVIDIFDKNQNIWYSQKINSTDTTSFNLLSWSYVLNSAVEWFAKPALQNILLTWAQSLTITLPSEFKVISWVVNDSLWSPLFDAFVQVTDKQTWRSVSTKTASNWIFSITVQTWSTYQLQAQKLGYISSAAQDISTWSNIITLKSSLITQSSVVLSWIVIGTWIDSQTIVSIAEYDTVSWLKIATGQALTMQLDQNNAYNFVLPTGKKWILAIASPTYRSVDLTATGFSTNALTTNLRFDYTMPSQNLITPAQPQITSIQPDLPWVIKDAQSNISLSIPAWALSDGATTTSVQTKNSYLAPSTAANKPIWSIAKDVVIHDNNWTAITKLNNDVSLEIVYSWADIYNTYTWITVGTIKSMQVGYFDETVGDWISMPTSLRLSWDNTVVSVFQSTGDNVLLSAITWYQNLQFTFTLSTDHFTAFAALVKTVVIKSTTTNNNNSSSNNSNNSSNTWGGSSGWWSSWGGSNNSASIIAWVTALANDINTYLWSVNQTVTLVAWNNLNDIFTIKRDGKVLNFNQILSKTSSGLTNLSQWAVNFAVGDILASSKDWSIAINLDWYTKMNLKPGATTQIYAAGKWYIYYQNLSWSVEYSFQKRDNGSFDYQVKWQTSYATIRGTVLEVTSEKDRDVYKLIEGKIDVYNDVKKTTISMVAGDRLQIYSNWTAILNGKIYWLVETAPIVPVKPNVDNNDKVDTTTKDPVKVPSNKPTTTTIQSPKWPTIDRTKYSVVVVNWVEVEKNAYDAAWMLNQKWITKLLPNQTPFYEWLSRWQASLLFARFAKLAYNKSEANNSCSFDDISSYDTKTQEEMILSCKLGLFKWSNWKLYPKWAFTRAQTVIVFARLLSNNPDMELDESYDYLLKNKIITVDDRAKSSRFVQRYEVYLLLYRSLNKGS